MDLFDMHSSMLTPVKQLSGVPPRPRYRAQLLSPLATVLSRRGDQAGPGSLSLVAFAHGSLQQARQ